MSDSNGYGSFSAPGPADPGAGSYGNPGDYGQAGADPYTGGSPEYPAYGGAGHTTPPVDDPFSSPSRSGSADPYDIPADPYAASASQPAAHAGAASYGAPQQSMYAAPPTSNAATVGFVLGLVSVVLCQLTAPVGLVYSIRGMRETEAGQLGGRGLAIAGLVLSIVGTVFLVLMLLYLGFMAVMMITTFSAAGMY